MFHVVLIGVLPLLIASHHVYHIQPDDELCVQLSCRTLQDIISHHYMYFKSNTTLLFGEGYYNHIKDDLIVQDVTNFSLIGTQNTSDPTSAISVISCLPEHMIYFNNVTNFMIRDMKFEGCGSLMPKFSGPLYVGAIRHYWASVYVHFCTNLEVINVVIDNPVGFGISGLNVMGNSSLQNVTIIMGRKGLYGYILFTCSYAVHWVYGDSVGSDEDVFLHIMNIRLKQNLHEFSDCSTSIQDLMEVIVHQHRAHITISNSEFCKLTSNIIKYNISSLSQNSLEIHKCTFIGNSVSYIIEINCNKQATSLPREHDKLNIIFSDMDFIGNTFHTYNFYKFAESMLQCWVSSPLHLVLNNIWHYGNRLPLLTMSSMTPILANQSSLTVTITGYFVADGNGRLSYHGYLISIANGIMHFNGVTKFSSNVVSEIIHASSSLLIFSNVTVFIDNFCNQLLYLNCKMCYLALLGHVNLMIGYNKVNNEVIKMITRYNSPYPFCIFQLYSPVNNRLKDFSIKINLGNVKLSKLFEILRLTVHCRWASGAAFTNVNPLILNRNMIDINSTYHDQLGTHTTVCYCPPTSHYNCSVNQLGPIYPGENLTVRLSLPYNDDKAGILYTETYNDDLPKSSCKLGDYSSMKHVFHKRQCKTVHFMIAFEHQGAVGCELFLTAQPHLYTVYDVFHIHLLPCPLGFKLQHGICDCDPDLGKYIDDCMINTQTVRQFAAVYILGAVSENSSSTYVVSTDCPIDYCLQGKTRISLHDPDAQCQPHRTGLLCAQCTKEYSVVFGSGRCKKCSNKNLLFTLYILLAGLFLVVVLFVLNLTVTTGTITGHIFYVNIVWINTSHFHLHNRLTTFLYSYISIANLGASFEMCLYDQMGMYAKKWIQFAFPLFLVLIAVSFILISRYSNKLYRLTYYRALPVLATLLMLIYTSALQAIASAPLYTTIITIPGYSSKNLWLLDPTIPLFGWKFSLLITVCLLLFLFLLMFNAILLFTKPLMRFRIIHRFKPIIDAFQGPLKYEYYYCIGIQLLLRNVMVLLSIFGKTANILTSCIIIFAVAIIHGYVQPNKNNWINVQELLYLFNYATLCLLVIFDSSESTNVVTVNVVVGLSFVQFIVILFYHVFTFVKPCSNILTKSVKIIQNFIRTYYNCRRHSVHQEDSTGMEIPEVQFKFSDFQEPLIGED